MVKEAFVHPSFVLSSVEKRNSLVYCTQQESLSLALKVAKVCVVVTG